MRSATACCLRSRLEAIDITQWQTDDDLVNPHLQRERTRVSIVLEAEEAASSSGIRRVFF